MKQKPTEPLSLAGTTERTAGILLIVEGGSALCRLFRDTIGRG
jgi:hypothetical protein